MLSIEQLFLPRRPLNRQVRNKKILVPSNRTRLLRTRLGNYEAEEWER